MIEKPVRTIVFSVPPGSEIVGRLVGVTCAVGVAGIEVGTIVAAGMMVAVGTMIVGVGDGVGDGEMLILGDTEGTVVGEGVGVLVGVADGLFVGVAEGVADSMIWEPSGKIVNLFVTVTSSLFSSVPSIVIV